ncbi:DNA mismatch repair protein MutS [bacterium]|nr:DNA mismatch repair protein MutS [bacterium]
MPKGKSKTPLMKQYYAIKSRYPDSILFFRMGDFYEMFDDDAKIASEVLGIALTSRDHGLGKRTPLAGVPYHSAERYLSKLLRAGFKVAICEQVEDPKFAKGIVKRDVVEIMTPGTITVDSGAESFKNQYLVSILPEDDGFVNICAVDVLAGDFFTRRIKYDRALDEIALLEPSEFLIPDDVSEDFFNLLKERFPKIRISLFEPWNFERKNAEEVLLEHFKVASLSGLGKFSAGEISVAGAVLKYLRQLKKGALHHISTLRKAVYGDFMLLDEATVRNLELIASIADGSRYGTLLWSIDETITPMGGRLLRRWILAPLVNSQKISQRLEAVQTLIESGSYLTELRDLLSQVGDMERIAGKIGNHRANPRDMVVLAKGLRIVEKIRQMRIFSTVLLEEIYTHLDPLPEICSRIERTIVDEPPAQINDGGILKCGVLPELDELRSLHSDSSAVLKKMEEELRARTGIEKLRVRFNKVFGYFIEVSRTQAKKVPDDFIRKQTLVNAERFITPELKELESKLLAADERIKYIEREFFLSFVAELSVQASKIADVASALAKIDVLANFAYLAKKKRYTRPRITDDGAIIIKGGRHPVLEDILGRSAFIPNDVKLDQKQQIIILTGPNMAGKSTFLRQNGLIVLMSQMGCFVPAEDARITPVDRIFTRVGATDYIARGQSTFLVEMLEAANILRNATENSLVLLDEIGRGTSTYDGLSIAWAIAEFLHDSEKHRAKTIFATHYHELTELANYLPRVANFQVTVREVDGNISFMHTIIPGGCDDSYGIQVARLAGVPDEVISRAREILEVLEAGETPTKSMRRLGGRKGRVEQYGAYQISLFDPEYHPLVIALKELDINNITPMQALKILSEWKQKWER